LNFCNKRKILKTFFAFQFFSRKVENDELWYFSNISCMFLNPNNGFSFVTFAFIKYFNLFSNSTNPLTKLNKEIFWQIIYCVDPPNFPCLPPYFQSAPPFNHQARNSSQTKQKNCLHISAIFPNFSFTDDFLQVPKMLNTIFTV
jgi:hypothetical protein